MEAKEAILEVVVGSCLVAVAMVVVTMLEVV